MTTVNLRRSIRTGLQRRDRMETAAIQLFTERGVEATTVQDITDAADVAKGTFFNYFSGKHDVLAQRFARLAAEVVRSTETQGSEDAFVRLTEYFAFAEGKFRKEGPGMLLLYREALVRPDLRTVDTEAEERILGFYSDLLSRGQASGSLRRSFDPGLGAHLINDVWASTLRSWMSSGGEFGLTERLQKKVGLIFDGFRSPVT